MRMKKHIQNDRITQNSITAKSLVKIGEYIVEGISDGINVIYDIPVLRELVQSCYCK